MRVRLAAFAAGALLVITGTAFTYWPASLILTGLALVAFGLMADDGSKP